MMLYKPLEPGKDGVLHVSILGRISTPGQDPESITSMHEDSEHWLHRVYNGPMEIKRFGEQASGWLANRPSMEAVKALIAAGECDLVLATELREIYRNPAFHWSIVQYCCDHGVRFILTANNVDTASPFWEQAFHLASLMAGLEVPAARQRVRRKATHAFSTGGMVMKVKFGYRKLSKEEAKSGQFGTPGLGLMKLVQWTEIIKEMRRRLLCGDSYEQIADWLNETGTPPGPYSVLGRWTGRLVRDLLEDPILSGRRRFRVNLDQLVYATGKHRSVPNPEPETQEFPELAHLTVEEQDEILPIIARRRDESAAGQRKGRESPLFNRPRSRTIWPGQQARCAICKGLMYRSGSFLKCENALAQGPRSCWNHVHVKYDEIYDKVIPWVVKILDQQPRVRGTIVQFAWSAFQVASRRRQNSGNATEQELKDLDQQAQALTKAISRGGNLESLVEELSRVETARKEARQKLASLTNDACEYDTFRSESDIAERLEEALLRMAKTSLDFADVLRRLIPTFVILPVQALDYPQVRPRARLTLSLKSWALGNEAPFETSTVIDLFEAPEHIKHLGRCVEAKRTHPEMSLREIGPLLGINYMTVKRALGYARLMEKEGLVDPYRELHEAPSSASRWGKRQRPDVEGNSAA